MDTLGFLLRNANDMCRHQNLMACIAVMEHAKPLFETVIYRLEHFQANRNYLEARPWQLLNSAEPQTAPTPTIL
jgi:hypothetical protein